MYWFDLFKFIFYTAPGLVVFLVCLFVIVHIFLCVTGDDW